ncbi:MAG: hypothetical protein LBK25_07950 [Treponema sp.]|jgi:hypothetical protein|nr:hypothetical protein [Treponema sp.]
MLAKTALATETDRAQAAEQDITTALVQEATTPANATVAYAGATHILTLTKGGGGARTQTLPLTSDTTDDFMPKEAHARLL